jgi:hypothetical protein
MGNEMNRCKLGTKSGRPQLFDHFADLALEGDGGLFQHTSVFTTTTATTTATTTTTTTTTAGSEPIRLLCQQALFFPLCLQAHLVFLQNFNKMHRARNLGELKGEFCNSEKALK